MLFASQILSLPFSVYGTFVIEEKYGFNKTTPKTFVLDILKGWLLAIVIGAPVFSAVLWFFEKTGPMAWAYCWGALTVIQVFLMFIAPVVIMPIFNKFIPLEDGELKTAIEDYAKKQGFKMKGVFSMDGSKRSTKANAFFTGFGRFRRIVLFDTLISKHTTEELVSILAHEMGHYKKRHILKVHYHFHSFNGAHVLYPFHLHEQPGSVSSVSDGACLHLWQSFLFRLSLCPHRNDPLHFRQHALPPA